MRVSLIEEPRYSAATTPEALLHLANGLCKRPNRGNPLSIYAHQEAALFWAVANLRKGVLIINVQPFQLFANHWLRASSDLPTRVLYGADIFTRRAETSMRISVFATTASLLLTGCTATTGKPEVIAEQQTTPDAWENRLEKIMDDKEIVSTKSKEDAGNISLEQQYKSEQRQVADSFENCFAKVFAGKTFDGGVPWKSEGQGYRDIISVNNQGVAAWWTISRRSRSCEPLTTPIQDYQSARIGQEISFDASPFNPSFYSIGKWMIENNNTELCWYERRSTLKGVSRRCYEHMPSFIPG